MKTLNALALFIPLSVAQPLIAQGLKWDTEAFAQREQIQPTRDVLPSSASLKRYAPFTHSQYGSTCVAFSLASARTILYAKRNGLTDKETISANSFSPWFIYYRNRDLRDRDCSMGLDADKAITDLMNTGVQRLMKVEYGEYYPFTQHLLTNFYPPDYSEDVREAQAFELAAAYRLETVDDMRFALANGMPIVIGVLPPASFEQAIGVSVWNPTAQEQPVPENAHALVVVGYDDSKYGGAVEVLNSWGSKWGTGGYVWVRYADLLRFTVGAYALSDAAPARYRKEPTAEQDPTAGDEGNASPWRAMSDFTFKCGSPETTISQYAGLDPRLLVK